MSREKGRKRKKEEEINEKKRKMEKRKTQIQGAPVIRQLDRSPDVCMWYVECCLFFFECHL